jgi:hypothetical protein
VKKVRLRVATLFVDSFWRLFVNSLPRGLSKPHVLTFSKTNYWLRQIKGEDYKII